MSRPSLACAFVLAAMLPAQAPTIDPAGLPGTRVLAGGGKVGPTIHARFVEAAGGTAAARVVLMPTASEAADDDTDRRAIVERWRLACPGVACELLHTRDRALADSEEFTAPLRAATGVWFGGGAQENLAKAYVGTRVERELQALLARGGAVGGTSAGTAIQTRTMIQEGRDPPVIAQGLDFVPFAIADQHFTERDRLGRLLQALAMQPGHFGIGVDERTAVVIGGRSMAVLGPGKATLVLAAANGRGERRVALGAGEAADLVTWQRAARSRAAGPWPPPRFGEPRIASGALVIVGGGRIPDAVARRFVELAGGASAKVVLVPGAAPAAERRDDAFAATLRELGVTDVRTLDAAHPRDVTAERLAALADATAVWFGGGRQWRLVDAFEGTPAIAAIRAVLARGGVIGGTSAGATIQGEFLVRGNPLGNAEMWCEGYDRGFALLPGCAIDQHFVTRDRTGDLQALITRLPQLIGLGVDEGTAAVVRGSELEVLGDSKVAVFDARATPASPPEPTWLASGERWDLVAGKRAR